MTKNKFFLVFVVLFGFVAYLSMNRVNSEESVKGVTMKLVASNDYQQFWFVSNPDTQMFRENPPRANIMEAISAQGQKSGKRVACLMPIQSGQSNHGYYAIMEDPVGKK
jgi:hypothetical protein